MKQSKSIFERIKLYRVNYNRNKKNKEKDSKKTIDENTNEIIKKQPKIKLFFKFVVGFIAGFFEYLVMKSNKKNSIKSNNSSINQNSKSISNDLNINNNQNNIEKINVNIDQKKINNFIDNSNKIDLKIEESNKNITKKIDSYSNNLVKKEKEELQQVKKELILVEESIIYADNYEELEGAKTKILATKKELQFKKDNNLIAVEHLEKDKKRVINNTEIKEDILKDEIDKKTLENSKFFNDRENLTTKSQILTNETIPNIEKDITINNQEVDKLIERCDEDLILIEEKKEYIHLQENYEKHLDEVKQDSKEFKLTKKDLKQIKNNVNSILERQKYNLQSLNDYMNMPTNSQLSLAKLNNFFKSTTKLSFSIIPFFVFPNKLLGLTTSAIMFNNSLKSYRMQPNTNYINQNLKAMISNNELCLRVGINASKEALGEVDNIKYYLSNVPSEVKDTLEYRKYLVDVISTEKIVKKQIEVLQKMSKDYQGIKVKIKNKNFNT